MFRIERVWKGGESDPDKPIDAPPLTSPPKGRGDGRGRGGEGMEWGMMGRQDWTRRGSAANYNGENWSRRRHLSFSKQRELPHRPRSEEP